MREGNFEELSNMSAIESVKVQTEHCKGIVFFSLDSFGKTTSTRDHKSLSSSDTLTLRQSLWECIICNLEMF